MVGIAGHLVADIAGFDRPAECHLVERPVADFHPYRSSRRFPSRHAPPKGLSDRSTTAHLPRRSLILRGPQPRPVEIPTRVDDPGISRGHPPALPHFAVVDGPATSDPPSPRARSNERATSPHAELAVREHHRRGASERPGPTVDDPEASPARPASDESTDLWNTANQNGDMPRLVMAAATSLTAVRRVAALQHPNRLFRQQGQRTPQPSVRNAQGRADPRDPSQFPDLGHGT